MGDHTVAMTVAAMVCAALHSRHSTGKGQLVTTSLLRQAAYTVGFDINTHLLWGLPIQVGTREAMSNPTANNYRTADGRRIWLTGIEPERHWPALARAVGRPEWIHDERYTTPLGRHRHAAELTAQLDAIFATKGLAQWVEIFAEEPDMFWSPVNTVDDLVSDPQFHAAGGLVDVPDGVSTTTMVATPADFLGSPSHPTKTAPRLGEHTEEVLAELRNGEEGSHP
jgi:crotonobetainyl-CoA:carnitine CoA-transferase CaiB-like acyl-CoA transferase